MFELLLQADKSLSDGLLDQAERTYWQLIELDPTNAIAVAGLARISLQRGDGRVARTFADRALGIDPDSIVARKVIHALEEGAALPEEWSTPDINLRGAERLEALGRRHTSRLGGDEGGEGAAWSGWARTSGRGKPAQLPVPVPAPTPRSVKPIRGKIGRLAAAAAAAAAAVREPTHTRHEPHHAMHTGRRMFEPRPVNAAPDPFAAAEMAAVVAAVGAMDEPYESEPSAELAAEVETAGRDEADTEAAARVEATAEGVADTVAEAAAALEATARVEAKAAAECDAGEPPEVEPRAEPEPATAIDTAAAVEAATAAEPGPDALDAAHVMEAVDATGVGESVALRLASLLSPIPEAPAEPEAEADAETQAPREAMAVALLSQNVDDTAGEPGAALEYEATTHDPAETEPQTHCAEAPPDADAPEEAPADHDSAPRKWGLFRRFRG
jgi:hypothetical protein